MPLPSTTALLGKVASKKLVLSEQGSSMAEDPTALYTGRDSEDRPYGQLTELGALNPDHGLIFVFVLS